MLISNTISLNDTTPTLIVDGSTLGEYVVHLRVVAAINIGDPSVSLSSGLSLFAMPTNAELFTARLQGDSIWAVSQAPTGVVGVLAYSA